MFKTSSKDSEKHTRELIPLAPLNTIRVVSMAVKERDRITTLYCSTQTLTSYRNVGAKVRYTTDLLRVLVLDILSNICAKEDGDLNTGTTTVFLNSRLCQNISERGILLELLSDGIIQISITGCIVQLKMESKSRCRDIIRIKSIVFTSENK